MGPFSIYEQPKYKPNLTLSLTLILIQTLILTQILTLKPTWVDATIRSHFGCSYIEKEPLDALQYLWGPSAWGFSLPKNVLSHKFLYEHPPPSIHPTTPLATFNHLSTLPNVLFCFRYPSIIYYAWFGFSYFYYDLGAMFLEAREAHSEKRFLTVCKIFLSKKYLLVLHHVFLPLFGFPIIVVSLNCMWIIKSQ